MRFWLLAAWSLLLAWGAGIAFAVETIAPTQTAVIPETVPLAEAAAPDPAQEEAARLAAIVAAFAAPTEPAPAAEEPVVLAQAPARPEGGLDPADYEDAGFQEEDYADAGVPDTTWFELLYDFITMDSVYFTYTHYDIWPDLFTNYDDLHVVDPDLILDMVLPDPDLYDLPDD
jgi:hypothetical protein